MLVCATENDNPLPNNIIFAALQMSTRRSVEHCTPHADGAWLVTVVMKYNSCIFMVIESKNSTKASTM